MIFRNASEHFATPATEAATTASTTGSAKPVGAQANSRFAYVEAYGVGERPKLQEREALESFRGTIVLTGLPALLIVYPFLVDGFENHLWRDLPDATPVRARLPGKTGRTGKVQS